MALHTVSGAWSRLLLQGVTEAAQRHGSLVDHVYGAEFDANLQCAQLEQIRRASVDAIIIAPIPTSGTGEACRALADAGRDLVLLENVPPGLEPQRDYITMVTSDNVGNGAEAASLLAPYVGANETILAVAYEREFFPTEERLTGFQEWFRASRPDVGVDVARFTRTEDAATVVGDALDAGIPIRGVFVVWEEPAMQALQALRERDARLPVVTVDLGEDAIRELRRGDLLVGTVAQRPFDHGDAAVAALVASAEQPTIPARLTIPGRVVTGANLEQAYRDVWHDLYPGTPL